MLTWPAIRAVLAHPSLWFEGVRSVVALSSGPWWRLVPEPRYLAWRTATAYGNPAAKIAADDLVAYLRWRKRQRS